MPRFRKNANSLFRDFAHVGCAIHAPSLGQLAQERLPSILDGKQFSRRGGSLVRLRSL